MTGSAERPGRLPDFFIVGHPKSGTTALHEMLRSHPQVFMPELKEPRYFARDLRPLFGSRELGPGSPPLPETLEDYLELFREAEPWQRAGEATPSYLRSKVAAELIARAQPAARIVAVLREPASFLRSLHLELVQNHVETEQDLRRALANEHDSPARRAEGAPAEGAPGLSRYSDRVRYVEQLRRYHAAFPPEQVLVLIYDDFRSDNEGTMRRVLRFLEVDDTVPIASVEANPTVRVRSLRLDRALRSLSAGQDPVARAAGAALKPLIPAQVRHRARRAVRRGLLYGKPKPPDARLMEELQRRFKPEVVALSEYLDRDLVSLWGYDRLG